MLKKKEKIVSFDYMNRKEYIVDTVTGIMVAGILICVLRGVTSFFLQWINGLLAGDGWMFYVRTLVSAAVSSFSVAFPIFLYGLAVDSKVRTVFAKKSAQPASQRAIVCVLGVLAAVSAAILCLRASFWTMETASQSGYVFSMDTPDIGTGTLQHVFYIAAYALIPALICEPFYRGVVMNRLSKDSYLLAVLIPAVIFAANHPTVPQMPYMFVVGIILGWTYLKTDDIKVPVIIHAATNAVIGCLYVKAGSPEAFTLEDLSPITLVGLGLIFVGLAVFAAGSPVKRPPQENRPFSIKESLKGLFGTFGIYVLIIVVIFQLGAFHIDNPTFEIKGSEEDGPTQSERYEDDNTSEQDEIEQ